MSKMFGFGRRRKLNELAAYAPKDEADLDLVLNSIHPSIRSIYAKMTIKGIEDVEAQLRENLPEHCHIDPYIFTEPSDLFECAQIMFSAGAENIAKHEMQPVTEGTVQKIIGFWLVAKALRADELDNLNVQNPSLESIYSANPVIGVRMEEKIKSILSLANSAQSQSDTDALYRE